MNKLRSSLESNKTALEIALTMGTILILTEQKRSTSGQTNHLVTIMQQNNSILTASDRVEQRLDVLPELRRGAAQVQSISCELICLRNQLAALARRDGGHQSS